MLEEGAFSGWHKSRKGMLLVSTQTKFTSPKSHRYSPEFARYWVVYHSGA